VKRARMKTGCRPPYAGARRGVLPEHPTYWDVTPDIEAAVALLAEDGQVEYEPSFARGAGGQFAIAAAEPALALVAAAPPAPASPNPYARKGGKGR
jgi:hypothetical protein